MNAPALKFFTVEHCIKALFALALLTPHTHALPSQQQETVVDDTRHFLQRTGFALPPAAVIEKSSLSSAQLLYNQHTLFQQHALGNFADLLSAIMQDPAMLIYLDNRSNVKSTPNENLAALVKSPAKFVADTLRVWQLY